MRRPLESSGTLSVVMVNKDILLFPGCLYQHGSRQFCAHLSPGPYWRVRAAAPLPMTLDRNVRPAKLATAVRELTTGTLLTPSHIASLNFPTGDLTKREAELG